MITAQEMVAKLGGKWSGRYAMVRCPCHKDGTPSLQISVGHGGRPLVHCFGGCEFRLLAPALKKACGTDEDWTADPAAPTRLTPQWSESDPERERRREHAKELWKASVAVDPGSIPDRYLAYRGITVRSPALRWLQALKHSPSGLMFPAMLSGIHDEAGRLCAVQRTWLRPDGLGKAEVGGKTIDQAKMTLGPMGHGAVQLSKPRDVLGLAEGTETGLSARQLYSLPVWAVLSATRLGAIVPPEGVKRLVIFADNGTVGQAEAAKARGVYQDMGLPCEVMTPEHGLSDFNDVLQDQGGNA